MNDADRAIAVSHIGTQHRIGTVDGPCYEALKLVLGEGNMSVPALPVVLFDKRPDDLEVGRLGYAESKETSGLAGGRALVNRACGAIIRHFPSPHGWLERLMAPTNASTAKMRGNRP
jgi:hypothetical protein